MNSRTDLSADRIGLSSTSEPLDAVSARPLAPQSRPIMLADTLAWAVSHGIPLAEAIDSLPFYRTAGATRAGATRQLTPSFLWLRGRGAAGSASWDARLGGLKESLAKGNKLSLALAANCERLLPRHFILGVAKAEEDGRLETALPLLAAQMNQSTATAQEIRAVLGFLSARLITVTATLLFLLLFIVPRFDEIMAELLEADGSHAWISAAAFSRSVSAIILSMVGVAVLVAAVWGSERVRDNVVMYLPYLRKLRGRFLVADLSNALQAFLADGDDMLTAARWSREATRSPWMRRRVDRFVEGLQKGAYWVDAWRRMGLGDDLQLFIVHNAGAREDPASGFEELAQWLHYENISMLRRLCIWLDPICTLVMAAFVGSICVFFFKCLVDLMNGLF